MKKDGPVPDMSRRGLLRFGLGASLMANIALPDTLVARRPCAGHSQKDKGEDPMLAKTDFPVRTIAQVGATVGESPMWCEQEKVLYWVDIGKGTVNRFDPATDANTHWTVPSTPGCVGIGPAGSLVIAAHDGVYMLTMATGAFDRLADVPYNEKLFRFNDGRVDRAGRFWMGQMALNPRLPHCHDTGILYAFDGRIMKPTIAPIWAANGTAFSPDGKLLYRAETLDRKIYVYDLDASGHPSNGRLFATVPDALGLPDGATVDAQGGYWAALPVGPGGGSVIRFTPGGKLDLWFPTPVAVPLMIAFGGPDLATMYITSGRLEKEYGLPEHELSGSIFAVDTGFRGVPEPRFVMAPPL